MLQGGADSALCASLQLDSHHVLVGCPHVARFVSNRLVPVDLPNMAVRVDDLAARVHLLLHLVIGERNGNAMAMAVFWYAPSGRHSLLGHAHQGILEYHDLNIRSEFHGIELFILSEEPLEGNRTQQKDDKAD